MYFGTVLFCFYLCFALCAFCLKKKTLFHQMMFVLFQPQYTTTGQVPGQQPVVQLPVGTVQPGAVMQSQMPPSQPAPVPMVTPQTQQYQWYQQVPSAVGSVAVSTPITQNTPMQGIFKYSGSAWLLNLQSLFLLLHYRTGLKNNCATFSCDQK